MQTSFNRLLEYRHRQVVISVYREEELLDRDGVMFDEIRASAIDLTFWRANCKVKELPITETTPLNEQPGFPRYYAYEYNGCRIELYFP